MPMLTRSAGPAWCWHDAPTWTADEMADGKTGRLPGDAQAYPHDLWQCSLCGALLHARARWNGRGRLTWHAASWWQAQLYRGNLRTGRHRAPAAGIRTSRSVA